MADHLFDPRLGVDEDLLGLWSGAAELRLADVVAPHQDSRPPASGAAARDARPAPGDAFRPVTITHVRDEAEDCRSFAFDSSGWPDFAPQPGQFFRMRVTLGGAVHERCYALSSLVARGDAPRFTVKRVPGGLVSGWCHDVLRPGMQVSITPPQGTFLLRPGSRPAAFLAGGLGMAPLFPLVKEAVLAGGRPVRLILVDRSEARAVFLRELRALARHPAGLFSFAPVFTGAAGRVTPEDLAPRLAGLAHGDLYACGPAGFMRCAKAAGVLAGVPRQRIFLNVR